MTINVQESLNETNLAEKLDEDELIEIGNIVSEGYQADKDSCKGLWELLDQWTQLALQIANKKTFPWENASNVKYPLLATASMQFAARAYPSLVPANGQVVKCKYVGSDPTGEKAIKADRVSKFMSYQLLDEMEEWEEEMDRLLITLPIVGTVFKKTYWDKEKGRNYSCLVMPKDLVVNYWAKTLEDAERVTQIIPMSTRVIKEKQRAGIFLDVDLGEPVPDDTKTQAVNPSGLSLPNNDSTTPYTILEQHCYLDLDEDDYPEPYIVTFEENSKKILRIAPRFLEDDVSVTGEGEISKITPIQYYTKFSFVPNPDGGFYDIGFGRLLGSLNDSVDTILNQLIDAGTLSNLQAGFIGKGLRIKMGDSKFKPGEWKVVNATGSDIKQQIFPLPTRDPSPVLMQLLQFLITYSKELASVAEIFVGKMPGQNTPATTTMASIDQGMKVFTAVYKRIFRSLTKEFRKLYRLNKSYLNPKTEVAILGIAMPQTDFNGPENMVIPAADPAAVSAQEKQAKVQALLQIIQLGTIDPMMVTQLYLDAYEIPQADKVIKQPSPPPPDPEMEKMKLESQIKGQEHQQKMTAEQGKHALKQAEGAQKLETSRQLSEIKVREEAILSELERRKAMGDHMQQSVQGQQQHMLKMKQSAEAHAQKMKQQPKKGNK